MAQILIPIPASDFDPTEVAIPWRVLTQQGHDVLFATPDGRPGSADEIMLTGEGLDPWGFAPVLRKAPLIGLMLRANADARAAYAQMAQSANFLQPLRWSDANDGFDGLILPGGHRARGMRDYLESEILQKLIVAYMKANKPLGAICHGVLLAARSIDPATGSSVLFGRQTTALTWSLERSAASLGRFMRFWDPHYYRTYRDQRGQPTGYMSVEHEVTRALANATDFRDVPSDDPQFQRKTSGLVRDSEADGTPAFVVCDGNYISARWPGDAHAFATAFASLLETIPVAVVNAENAPT